MSIFAILAYPASHSLSPAMHNAAFQYLKLPHRYGRCEIKPEDLESFFKGDAKNYTGFSVSVPHKETCMQFLDEIDESAQIIGAVNTIIQKNGKLKGYNTDYLGFIHSLCEHFNPQEKTILIIGAGGASRAIVYALKESNVKKIYIWNRSSEKAKQLAEEFEIEAINDIFTIQDEVDLVVNTTSLGMKGKDEGKSPILKEFWKSHHTAYDIVYTPTHTQFLIDVVSANAIAISGERMLSFQALYQVKLFTEQNIPVDILEFGLHLSKRTFDHFEAVKFTEKEKKDVLKTIVVNKSSELFLSFEYEINPIKNKIPHVFLHALQKEKQTPHIIAEIKPASPREGKLIRENENIENIAKEYKEGGATALSIITDYVFFGGLVHNISKVKKTISLPILRKDFIIHESQIAEASFYGADAVLLMRSVLTSQRLQELLEYAERLGLDALVEIHTESELLSVLNDTTAQIIGINARNLHTLEINPLNFSELLAKVKSHPRFSEIIWVAESGISSYDDIKKYASKANALLVGSSLMKSENKVESLKNLLYKT